MTRSAFLLKLLAAVGIGQAVTLRPPKGNTGLLSAGPSQDTPRWKVIKRADGTDCRAYDYVGADSKGNYVCIPEQCEPKPGESRCPMGHCQKPRTYYVKTYPYCSDLTDVGGIPEGLGHSVCSICGIVYVPSS